MIAATIGTLAVGAGIAAVPFVKSLGPNDKGRASLLEVDISDLAIDHVKIIDRSRIRIFLERLPPDEVIALVVPVQDGAVRMPDEKWWRLWSSCRNFGPENKSGQLTNGGSFRCRDPDVDEALARLWVWDAAGRYAGPPNVPFDDMPRAKVERRASSALLRVPDYF